MPELTLDWSAAEYENAVDGGSIWVPVAGGPGDDAWWAAFRETLAVHESETRGQLWRVLEVAENEIVLHGVPEGVDASSVRARLEEYLQSAASSADHAVARTEPRSDRADAADEARRVRAAEAFQRQLRETDG